LVVLPECQDPLVGQIAEQQLERPVAQLLGFDGELAF